MRLRYYINKQTLDKSSNITSELKSNVNVFPFRAIPAGRLSSAIIFWDFFSPAVYLCAVCVS